MRWERCSPVVLAGKKPPENSGASHLGNGNPLQYSCLENPMDRGVWWATACRVTNSGTGLSDFRTHPIARGRKRPGPWWRQSLKQEGFPLPLRKKDTYLEERLWLHSSTEGTSCSAGEFLYQKVKLQNPVLFLPFFTTVDTTFKEWSGAKETKTLCASQQYAFFCAVPSTLAA